MAHNAANWNSSRGFFSFFLLPACVACAGAREEIRRKTTTNERNNETMEKAKEMNEYFFGSFTLQRFRRRDYNFWGYISVKRYLVYESINNHRCSWTLFFSLFFFVVVVASLHLPSRTFYLKFMRNQETFLCFYNFISCKKKVKDLRYHS